MALVGKPCRRCGSTIRYGSGACGPCHKKQARAYELKNPARTSAMQKRKYDKAKQKSPAGFLLSSAKARAKEKGLEFSITAADISIPATCPLLDIPLMTARRAATANSPTIDRIDNSKGYVSGNVWVISYRANMLKGDANADELAKLVGRLQFFIALRSAT